MCELHTLQEIKINWDEAPPLQEPGEKEKTSMGDMFTNDLLSNDSKLWCHQFTSLETERNLSENVSRKCFWDRYKGRAVS